MKAADCDVDALSRQQPAPVETLASDGNVAASNAYDQQACGITPPTT